MLADHLGKRRNFSTRDHVYETLKENIIRLNLKPGQSVSEKEISEMLNVSRTPVREAFVKLAQEELLEVYPQRGTFISLIDLDHVEEVRFIRELLERASAKLAAENPQNVDLVSLKENLQRQRFCIDEKNYEKLFELDEELIKQEYPCTDDEAFIASGKCYFDTETIIKRIDELEKLENDGIQDTGYFTYKIVTKNNNKEITDIKWTSDPSGTIIIYKYPIERIPYVLGGDTAGEGSDYFTGIVINNTNKQIVAKLRIEQDETEYTRQIYCLGKYYNDALLGLEVNFSTYPTKMLSEEYNYVKEVDYISGAYEKSKKLEVLIEDLFSLTKMNYHFDVL